MNQVFLSLEALSVSSITSNSVSSVSPSLSGFNNNSSPVHSLSNNASPAVKNVEPSLRKLLTLKKQSSLKSPLSAGNFLCLLFISSVVFLLFLYVYIYIYASFYLSLFLAISHLQTLSLSLSHFSLILL